MELIPIMVMSSSVQMEDGEQYAVMDGIYKTLLFYVTSCITLPKVCLARFNFQESISLKLSGEMIKGSKQSDFFLSNVTCVGTERYILQ